MKWKSELTINKTALISRRISWSGWLIFVASGCIGAFLIFNKLTWKWLEVIELALLVISFTLIAVSWIMPGVLILLGVPWLAHAWLRGINPITVSSTPWTQMSTGEKVSIYLLSIFLSSSTVFAIIGIIRFNLQK